MKAFGSSKCTNFSIRLLSTFSIRGCRCGFHRCCFDKIRKYQEVNDQRDFFQSYSYQIEVFSFKKLKSHFCIFLSLVVTNFMNYLTIKSM